LRERAIAEEGEGIPCSKTKEMGRDEKRYRISGGSTLTFFNRSWLKGVGEEKRCYQARG